MTMNGHETLKSMIDKAAKLERDAAELKAGLEAVLRATVAPLMGDVAWPENGKPTRTREGKEIVNDVGAVITRHRE